MTPIYTSRNDTRIVVVARSASNASLMLAYVFFSGIMRRDMRSVSVSLLVAFLYGSLIWGVLPIRPHMSWELHLSGGIMGVLLAFLYRKWDRVPVIRYDWEEDDSVPEWYPDEEPKDLDVPDDHP